MLYKAWLSRLWLRREGSKILSFILFLLYLPSAFLPQTAGPFSVWCTDLLSPGSSLGHFPTGENHEDLHLDFFYSGGPVWQQGLENCRHQESLLSWLRGRGVRDVSAIAGIGRRRGLSAAGFNF